MWRQRALNAQKDKRAPLLFFFIMCGRQPPLVAAAVVCVPAAVSITPPQNMESLADGYAVAEADLAYRGAGEIWGTRQAGEARSGFLQYARYGGLHTIDIPLTHPTSFSHPHRLVHTHMPPLLCTRKHTCHDPTLHRVPGPDNDLCGEAVVLAEQLLRRYGLDPDAWPRALLAAMRDIEPPADASPPTVEELISGMDAERGVSSSAGVELNPV